MPQDLPRSVFEPRPAAELVGFARVRTEHPEVRELQNAVVKLVADLNARAIARYAHAVPVGGVVAIPQGLFPEGWRLGEKWAPCLGQALTDPDSPITGRTLPAMAGDVGGVACDFWIRVKD